MEVNIKSNVKLITSGNIPTQDNLSAGEIAFGKISQDGKAHIYGNIGNSVVELSATDGTPGPKGDKGDKGDIGPKGDTGAQGIQGSPGVKGENGTAATITVGTVTTVASGSAAVVSNVGTASAAKLNFTIPQGPKGDTGATGIKGDKGDTGAQGIQGLQGPKGDTGLQGPKGDTGAQGIQGSPGVKGDTGAPGAKGDKGDKGDTGAAGSAGTQGPKGDTGAQGVAGKGISNTSITYQVHTNGTSAPTGTWQSSPQATTVGQFLWTRTILTYTDSTTSTIYSISAHGATGSQGVQGLKGDTGAQGIQGPQGLQGPKGDKGDTGETGIQGPPGIQGPKGDGGDLSFIYECTGSSDSTAIANIINNFFNNSTAMSMKLLITGTMGVSFTSSYAMQINATNTRGGICHVDFSDCSIPNITTSSRDFMYISSSTARLVVSGLNVTSTRYALCLSNANNNKFTDCLFKSTANHSIYINGSNYNKFTRCNCESSSNTQDTSGLYVSGTNNRFICCDISSTGMNGIYLIRGINYFDTCFIRSETQYGIYTSTQEFSAFFSNCTIYGKIAGIIGVSPHTQSMISLNSCYIESDGYDVSQLSDESTMKWSISNCTFSGSGIVVDGLAEVTYKLNGYVNMPQYSNRFRGVLKLSYTLTMTMGAGLSVANAVPVTGIGGTPSAVTITALATHYISSKGNWTVSGILMPSFTLPSPKGATLQFKLILPVNNSSIRPLGTTQVQS